MHLFGLLFQFLRCFAHRQTNLAVAIDVEHLDHDLVAFTQLVFNPPYSILGYLRDMQQPVGTG